MRDMKRPKSLSLLAPVLGVVLVSSLPAAAAPEVNIALRRAAWHSSAANVDNTAQLVSDGILGVLSDEVIDTSGTSASNPTFGQMVPGRVESEWISAGGGEEWVHLDLGAGARIGKVTVHWGSSYAVAYDLQVSDDARAWRSIAGARGRAGGAVATEIDAHARYLRVLCRTSSGGDYRIREIEVGGESGPPYRLPPQPAPEEDGSQRLTGGNWRIERASLVEADGATLSAAGYDDSGWLPATVPGTAFVSWLHAGAVPDPYYDDWQFQASDIFFTADFWYRNSFEIPAGQRGRRVYLDFDAVNWKADVWFNGRRLENSLEGYAHSIEGAFIRARFDVTALARFGGPNFLAVRIYRNRTPGLVTTQGLAEGPLPNGGELGQDNPTLHAAVGWDWLPTIRGRGIGIYNDVTVTCGGSVQLEDAWMETDLDIVETSANLSARNLASGRTVTQPAGQEGSDPAYVADNDESTQWIGADVDGAGFTVDLGEVTAIGSLEVVWGSEAGGAAASAESRHPAEFSVQVSDDGAGWRNFDSYAGGEVDTGWFGVRQADPAPGTGEHAGFDISNGVPGPVATVKVSFAGSDAFPVRIPVQQKARYVRFTATKRREVAEQGNRVVPVRVREIRIYAETAAEVAQSMVRTYELNDSQAELSFRADVHNYGPEPAEVTLEGVITPGNVRFSRTITVPGNGRREAVIDGILLDAPELWWPNTYGGQPLYTATVTARRAGGVEDRTSFRFGVREFTYPIDGNRLTIYCNGTRIVAKGGNWGMDDGLKTDTPQKYDDKMRLHAEANFTMIRNWVGMTNHRAFYEAADRYGILLWDDFWLANPADGPDPDDEKMFLDNAVDKIRKVRRHPSLALYCGRNEASPPKNLDAGLRRLTRDHDRTRIYIPNSAADPVGSGGGYAVAAMPNRNDGTGIREYFNEVPYVTLRSECGIPNVPSLESMRKFLPGEKLWPINESWALHDWTYHMNGPANTYMDALQLYKPGAFTVPTDHVQGQKPDPSDPVFARYKKEVLEMVAAAGRAYTLEEFQKMAQMINYENFKGVYEGLSVKRSNGFLMWMSQSSWPSFMWQTYDWYLDTNAGYFGARAANQPTHAVWDPRDDAVVLSNLSTASYSGVVTSLGVFDLDGRPVSEREWVTPALAPDSYGIRLGTADFSQSPTDLVFIRLTVRDGSGRRLGDNLYWHNRKDYMRYEALNRLPEVRLRAAVSPGVTVDGETGRGNIRYTLTFRNDGPAPAVQTRIRTTAGATERDILPAFYSDNYFGLMPGESRTVTVEFDPRRLDGERPRFLLGGWNTRPETIEPAE